MNNKYLAPAGGEDICSRGYPALGNQSQSREEGVHAREGMTVESEYWLHTEELIK